MSSGVVELTAEDTHPLRKRVLRDGTKSDVLVFDGDDLGDTCHLGFRATDGTLVGISTWLLRAYPDRPAVVGYQLRGMATDPGHRGTGAGAAMLVAGLDRCRALGAGLDAILVRTGKYRSEAVAASGIEPTATIDSIAALPQLLTQ